MTADRAPAPGDRPLTQVRMLGRTAISRGDDALALPPSRKVRALFAYLALAPRPVARSRLCELLWDVPNDPRGELRWCLSKLRSVLDEPGRRRVVTHEDTVALDLSDCHVDAIEVARASESGLEALGREQQRALAQLFGGEFLEGLEIDRNPLFGGWLTAQRRRFRGCHAALLEHLVADASDADALGYLEKWLQLAPFDRRVHEMLLGALARCGRIQDGEEHLATAVRLFETEGLEAAPLRAAWRAARSQEAVLHDAPPAGVLPAEEPLVQAATRRASIAVMPFLDWSSAPGVRGGPADALAHDITTRLAKLRTLFVIAQGTVFALHERRIGAEEAGRTLNVDYVVSGSVQLRDKRLTVNVELAETRTARVVWAEIFNRALDDTFLVLDEIGNAIVASIASEIETIERNRAILRPPSSLDAWEALHRGLWHMYRFRKDDNERARGFFEQSLRLDPTFARAYAGLSFTHFQNAFQGWAKREPEIERAFATADQSLVADERDPAAHWAMGRALWLRGRHDESVDALERAIDLSPNFALGHYTLAFVQAQAGDPDAAIVASDYSRSLSPFDPLLFGMLGARALALVRLGRFDEAAEWAVKAAARANAHEHIHAIAAYSLTLAGRHGEAAAAMAEIQKRHPGYTVRDFLNAFHFDAAGAAAFGDAARRLAKA